MKGWKDGRIKDENVEEVWIKGNRMDELKIKVGAIEDVDGWLEDEKFQDRILKV